MYLMHLPLYIFFVVELIPLDNEQLVRGLLIATLVLTALMVPVCIANIALSIISIFKGDVDVSKTVMKVKLALIPWYVMNFTMCVVFVAVLFNPFMMIGIPFVIAFFVVTTYFCMLATSLPDVGYYIRRVLIKKEEQISAGRVLTIICLFIFCLDVVGSILFYAKNKKLAPIQTADAENN